MRLGRCVPQGRKGGFTPKVLSRSSPPRKPGLRDDRAALPVCGSRGRRRVSAGARDGRKLRMRRTCHSAAVAGALSQRGSLRPSEGVSDSEPCQCGVLEERLRGPLGSSWTAVMPNILRLICAEGRALRSVAITAQPSSSRAVDRLPVSAKREFCLLVSCLPF